MATRALPLAIALLLVSASASSVTRDLCIPECTDKLPGDMVPDPLDCRQYYVCLAGESYIESPFTCDPGMIFEEKCVPGENCDPLCGKKELCHYECDAVEISKIADQYDCTVYSDCLRGRRVNCPPEKPFFDGIACQTDEGKCCSCNPYCRISDIAHLVIDVIDCKKHYFCTEIGIPQYPSTCSSGNVDILSGSCSDTAPCVTLCTNVVGENGCIDIFTCEERGSFPKCRGKCEPEYYHCTKEDIGNIIKTSTCMSGTVFHPGTGLCVQPSDCPYEDTSTNQFRDGSHPV